MDTINDFGRGRKSWNSERLTAISPSMACRIVDFFDSNSNTIDFYQDGNLNALSVSQWAAA